MHTSPDMVSMIYKHKLILANINDSDDHNFLFISRDITVRLCEEMYI